MAIDNSVSFKMSDGAHSEDTLILRFEIIIFLHFQEKECIN